MSICIVGWGHTAFGKRTDADTETLTLEAARAALADAGIAPTDVDEIVVGSTGRLGDQAFPSSLPLQMDDAMRFTPSTNVENACATGTAAIHQGMAAIRSGRARFVLVVGVEKMTGASREEVANNLLKASYVKEESHIRGGFAGVFGLIAESYFQRHGDKSDALAAIAAKNHRNGAKNPLAHFQKDLGYDFCRHPSEKNPQVAGPLKRTDCSPVSDGAAALVLTDVETALSMPKAVIFRAAAHVNDFLPMSKRDVVLMEGCSEAWRQALDQGGAHPRRSRLRRDPRLLHHGRAPGVRGDGPRASGARAPRRSSTAGPRSAASCRSTRPAVSSPRAIPSARRASRCT